MKSTKDGRGKRQPHLYQVVVSALRSEVLRGVYPVGTSLPSELSLVERFGVSRHTVREALRHLRDLGLVESRQGKGTIVVKPGGPQVYVHTVNSIADLHDYKVKSVYDTEVQTLKLTEETAQRLGVPVEQPWLKIGGMRFELGSDEPICVVEIYVPGRFAGIGRLLGRRSGPVYALIEDVYGERIDEVDQTLQAAPARADIGDVLGIEEGSTTLEIKRIYRLLDGSPAEITFNHYKADSFSFSMKLRRMRNGG